MAVTVAILLVLTALGTVTAGYLRWPAAPLLLAIGVGYGLLTALGVRLPPLPYDSNVVFSLFFPAMLFAASYEMPWNDLRANLGRNVVLAISTVIAASLAVGTFGHLAFGLPLVAALLLGVCLADPDYGWFLARADEINTSRPLRRAVVSEGLIEGTAMLVLFVAFAEATETGVIDWLDVARSLFLGSPWAALIGVIVALAFSPIFRRSRTGAIAVVASLALPFMAYLPAQATGGVRLAAVAAAGLTAGHALDPVMSASARVTGHAAWGVLRLLIPGLIYLPAGALLVSSLEGDTHRQFVLVLLGLALATLSVAVRFAWVGALFLFSRLIGRDLGPWRDFATGLLGAQRGVFAVATALALPSAAALAVTAQQRDWLISLILATVIASQMFQPVLISFALARWPVPGDGRERRERDLADRVLQNAASVAVARVRLLELRNDDRISAEIFREREARLDYAELGDLKLRLRSRSDDSER